MTLESGRALEFCRDFTLFVSKLQPSRPHRPHRNLRGGTGPGTEKAVRAEGPRPGCPHTERAVGLSHNMHARSGGPLPPTQRFLPQTSTRGAAWTLLEASSSPSQRRVQGGLQTLQPLVFCPHKAGSRRPGAPPGCSRWLGPLRSSFLSWKPLCSSPRWGGPTDEGPSDPGASSKRGLVISVQDTVRSTRDTTD